MKMASSDLVWGILNRGFNAYRLKYKDGPEFTKESGNLTNLNTFKFSGLANAKTVEVSAENELVRMVEEDEEKKKFYDTISQSGDVSLSLTAKNRGRKVKVGKGSKFSGKISSKVGKRNKGEDYIVNMTKTNFYRADLTKFAVRRLRKLRKAAQRGKTQVAQSKGQVAK